MNCHRVVWLLSRLSIEKVGAGRAVARIRSGGGGRFVGLALVTVNGYLVCRGMCQGWQTGTGSLTYSSFCIGFEGGLRSPVP